MTPLLGVWIASAVGAVLFCLAGYLLARGRTAPPPPRPPGPDPARLQAELKAALDRELKLVAELSIAKGGQTGARSELTRKEEELASLRAERERLRRESQELKVKLGELREPRASAITEPKELAELERELEQVRSEAWTRTTELKRLRANLDQLQAEKKELLARVGPSEPKVVTARPDSSLVAEVERLRIALLHTRSERDGAVARAKELEAEAQRLRRVT